MKKKKTPAKKSAATKAPRMIDNFFAGFKIRPEEYVWLDAKTLSPHPMNWKFHSEKQMTEIEKSFDEFGWLPSMLALFNSRTGNLIDAHGRRQAALKSGKPMPVAVINVDEEMERRILATLDRVGEMRDTDPGKLQELLGSILENTGSMPTGYEPDALDKLKESFTLPANLPPRLDEGYGTTEQSKPKDVYPVGAEITCPNCDEKFKLP